MPHQLLTKISGKPTHAAIKQLERKVATNLIAVECPCGLYCRYLGKLLPEAIFTARYEGPYIPPSAAPPIYPVILPGTTTTRRTALDAQNESEQKNWQTMIHVCRIIVNQAAETIKNVYYMELEDPIKGLNGLLIHDLINHI